MESVLDRWASATERIAVCNTISRASSELVDSKESSDRSPILRLYTSRPPALPCRRYPFFMGVGRIFFYDTVRYVESNSPKAPILTT